MTDLFQYFRHKPPTQDEKQKSAEEISDSFSETQYEKNRASGNHLLEQLDDLDNDLASLNFPETSEYRNFQKASTDRISALSQSLIEFPASDRDLSQTDDLIQEALNFLNQECLEELKKALVSFDQKEADILSSFIHSAANTILKILNTVLDYGINTTRCESSQELYCVRLANLENRLRAAKAEFICSQCEKNIMIHTREKSQKKQYVREITDTSSLAKKAELITLKQTIRNLALDIEDLQAKWNSHYELSLISTDTDIIGLSDSEKLKMRKEQEYRLKEKAKQIEKNYAQLRDHLNASKAVTDEAEKITTDLNHMFGGMMEKEKQAEDETVRQTQKQQQRQKERSTV